MAGITSPWSFAELGASMTRLQTAGSHLTGRAWSQLSTFGVTRYRVTVSHFVAEVRALPAGIWQRAARDFKSLAGRREHLGAVLEAETGRLVYAVIVRLPVGSRDEAAHLRGRIRRSKSASMA